MANVRRWIGRGTCAIGVLAIVTPPVPASARSQEALKVTASAPTVQKSYAGFTNVTPDTGTAATNWQTCAQATYCDTIPLNIDPGAVTEYKVNVTLTWPNPKSAKNPNGNDLNVGVWVPSPPVPYCCREQRTTGTTDHPEVVTVTQNRKGASTYTLIVDNTAGANTGYTLKVELTTGADAAPIRSTPTPRPTPVRATAAPTPKPPTPLPTLRPIPSPTPTPRIVKVPGPDGTFTEQAVPVLEKGARERVRRQRVNMLAATAVAAGVLGFGGLGVVVVRRRLAARGRS